MRNGTWGKGRLEIDRSKSAVANHERRSDESRHRESIWNLRNPNGGESPPEATDDEANHRAHGKNGIVCDVEHHGADDWRYRREKTHGLGDPINEEQWINRYPKPHIWVFERKPNITREDGYKSLQRLGTTWSR